MGNSEWVLEMPLFLLFISLFVVTPIYPLRCPPFICVSSLTHSLSISLSLCVPPSLFNSDMFSPHFTSSLFCGKCTVISAGYLTAPWWQPVLLMFPRITSHRITSHHTSPTTYTICSCLCRESVACPLSPYGSLCLHLSSSTETRRRGHLLSCPLSLSLCNLFVRISLSVLCSFNNLSVFTSCFWFVL